MIPPLSRPLRAEDFGDTDSAVAALIQAFNQFQQETINCLSGGVDNTNLARTVRSGLSFSTDTNGAASVRVKHGLSQPPSAVMLARIQRRNGRPLAAEWGWAWEWVAQSDEVLLSFVDLPLSIDVVATVVME